MKQNIKRNQIYISQDILLSCQLENIVIDYIFKGFLINYPTFYLQRI
jgi:hypothetical protein